MNRCHRYGCSICNPPRDPFPPIMFMFVAALILFASYACIKIHERTHALSNSSVPK